MTRRAKPAAAAVGPTKGGGRESGDRSQPVLETATGSARSLSGAAANPAAWTNTDDAWFEWAKARLASDAERIRELEEEVERQSRRWVASDKALKSLGNSLGERAQQLDDAERTLADEQKTSAFQLARAERAEARVAERTFDHLYFFESESGKTIYVTHSATCPCKAREREED